MTFDAERILAHPGIERAYRYTRRDTMLHALSIGIGTHYTEPREVAFAYDAGLKAFPTLANVLGWVDMARDPAVRDPSLGIDPDRLVVAAVAMRVERPLAVEGEGVTRTRFAELVDKGAGNAGLVRVRKATLDASGASIGTLDTWIHVRGAGGFGGSPAGGPERVEMPDRAPDAVHEYATPPTIALLYRLSLNDQNAVHADPVYSRRVGFERPILHGLATFSVAVHGVMREIADYAIERFRSAGARTTAPVFPGDTLRTSMWRSGSQVMFRTVAVERAVEVLQSGRVELAP